MRLKQYLNELSSIYGKGITFIDIDESIFHTMARIFVINDKTGKIVKKLSNQDFNTYKLEKGFSYDFREFRDSAFFQRTSKPIPQTINRIKRMFKNIDVRGSKVVLLTARETFPSMKEFKDTFRKQGIPIDKIEIKFAGDIQKSAGSISAAKKKIVMEYVKTGAYRRVRLVDDDLTNLKKFLSIENEIPDEVLDKVKKKHHIEGEESIPPIQFFGLLVNQDGSLKKV